MIIFTYNKLDKYMQLNNCNDIVTDAFNNWYTIMRKGDFANFSELKKVFNSVDYVGNDRYVFNVMGNNYRLVVMIHFGIRTAYILFVGTHKEYDKIDAKNIEHKN